MTSAASRVIVIGAGKMLEPALARLRAKSLDVRVAGADEEAPAHADAAVVVIGPEAPNPAAIARRIRARAMPLHFIFVARPGHADSVRKALLFSAPPGTPWRLVTSANDALEGAVFEAIDAGRRARQVRTTLDRINLRLASAEPPEPTDYRRLVASDRYLASILRSVPDAIVSLTADGTVLSWNEGAAQMLGVAPAEAVGGRLHALARWSGDLGPLLQAALRERFVRSELRVGAGEAELLLDATFAAIDEEHSQVTAVALIMRDITERKRTEEALARSELLFRTLADNIAQLAWMADAQGWIYWYNKRWFEYTGTNLREMQGWGWRSVHHPEHLDRVVAKFKAHIEAQVPWEDTFPLRSANGQFRWFLSRAVPIRDEAGQVSTWFGTNTDITAERAAREALQEADQRKSEFISLLSHELRNPLAPIRSSIYLLEQTKDPEAARRAREVISRQTQHLARLVDDLLDVTRISRGKIQLVRARTEVGAVVRATVEDFRDVAAKAGVSLSLDAGDAPVYAEIDTARIGQVLGNLLHNALKFTPSGGRVEVRLGLEGHAVRISVHDTGAGIEPELLSRLFEPFVQGERTLARSHGGLGLGLALARGIVDMHGGRLSAESPGRDRGATFTVWIPASAEQAPTRRTQGPVAADADGPSQQVLIVDDNRDAADSLAQLVKLFGHDVDIAYDGPTALARARARRPDVILCDIGLPGMNGYEVARRVRDEMRGVRIVAVSGYAQAADLAAAAEAGFHEHLAKPPRPEEIRRVIHGH